MRTGYFFRSSLFEIEPGEDAATNPGIYGRQLAQWLKGKLSAAGYSSVEVIPEDWGWCVMCEREPLLLWVGCGIDEDSLDESASPDRPPRGADIVWHCFAEAERPFWKRLFQRIDPQPALNKLDADLRTILSQEPGIRLGAER